MSIPEKLEKRILEVKQDIQSLCLLKDKNIKFASSGEQVDEEIKFQETILKSLSNLMKNALL